MAEKPEKIEFRYERALDFRTIYADGVFGGPTPGGHVGNVPFGERCLELYQQHGEGS